MESCPIEIHHKIFALACTDGGRTGCALSLVSRRIHATSFAVRFHTVALYGDDHMRAFLRMLESQRLSPPIVKHLFLYDDIGEIILFDDPLSSSEQDPPDVVMSIISTLSPTLLSMFGSLQGLFAPYDRIIPSGSRFPLLRDLSLNVSRTPIPANFGSPDLPNLRRLHKWGASSGASDVAEIAAVARAAPKLAQIRLSNLTKAPTVVSALRTALERGSSETENDDKDKEPRLPASLEWVACQSALVTHSGWGRHGYATQPVMQRRLRDLAKEQEKMKILVEDNYTIEDCLKDWLDVIQEKEGCWGVSGIACAENGTERQAARRNKYITEEMLGYRRRGTRSSRPWNVDRMY